jgi:AAA15 family ATPase/GTPase
MLLRFDVTNYLSFKGSTEFNTFTGDFRRLENHVRKVKGVNVLKLSAIYGANASGKSNLIEALYFLMDSIQKGRVVLETSAFKGFEKEPSKFEIEIYSRLKTYIYGIEIVKDSIKSEFLYESSQTKDDKMIFERIVNQKGDSKITVSKPLLKTKKSKILKEHYEGLIKKDELFISQMSELKLDELSKHCSSVDYWFWSSLQIVFPTSTPTFFLENLLNDPGFMKFTKEILCSLDTGVKDLHIKTIDIYNYFGVDERDFADDLIQKLEQDGDSIPLSVDMIATIEKNKPVIKTLLVEHKSFTNKNLFTFDEESDGTKRLIEFMIMMYSLLASDKQEVVFVIDEIGRSIHPSLLVSLLKKISEQITKKGQLIFTTHESNLLDLAMLRPDEIWFAEKNNKSGNTEFSTLAEFKKIRTDLDIKKGYLNGRFGGIPILANFDDLKWTNYASEA